MSNDRRDAAVKEWENGVGEVTNAERNSFRDGYQAGVACHAESVADLKRHLQVSHNVLRTEFGRKCSLTAEMCDVCQEVEAESLSGAAPTERYKFETWAEDKGMIVDRLANGSYRYPMMDDRWEVWQAATAQAPSLEKAQGIEEIFAYWDCPCCSFPNCGHDHKSEIKQLLQNTLNALRANDEQERKR